MNALQPIKEHQTTINGLKIHYQTAGDPRNQPIVFLHGWGARKSALCGYGLNNVTSALAQHFYVLTIEQPGLIRSEPPKAVWNFKEYAGLVHSLVQQLGIKNPILSGQSFGGGVATAYASQYPDEVKALVMIDASQADRPQNFYYRSRFVLNPLYKKIVLSEWVPLFFKKALISSYMGTPWQHVTQDNVVSYAIMGDVQSDTHLNVDYRQLNLPILLLWGKKDTTVTPLKRAQEIVHEAPHAKLVVLPGGHIMIYRNIERVVKEILAFL